jgi:hypothetical protein
VDEEVRPVPAPPAQPDIVRDVGEESPDSSDTTDDEAEEDVSYDRLEGGSLIVNDGGYHDIR